MFLPPAAAPPSLLASTSFSDVECQFLAGNCFVMSVMGTWMMYILSRTVPVPKASIMVLRSDVGQRTRSFENVDVADDDGEIHE